MKLVQQAGSIVSLIVALTLAFAATSVGDETVAQPRPVAAGAPTLLVDGMASGESFQQPRWSPASDVIAFTGSEYRGIWIASPDANRPDVSRLTDEFSAGFRFSWSRDGSAILARTSQQVGPRRTHSAKIFDPSSGASQELTPPTTERLGIPVWFGDDATIAVAGNGTPRALQVHGRTPKTGAETRAVLLADGNAILRWNADGSVSALSIEHGDVLNLVVSPDGSRAAYEVMGGHLTIMDVDGRNRIDLGVGNRPAWSPDGRWIAFQRTHDDGHHITSSDLWVASVDGTWKANLTNTSDDLEMNPTWAPGGNAVAYDDRGSIFILPLRYE